MTAIVRGMIAVAGQHGYVEMLLGTGLFSHWVHVLDDHGLPTQTYVTGCAFNSRINELYTTSTPDPTQDDVEHDVAWIPNGSNLLVAVVPTPGHINLRKCTKDGAVLREWTNVSHDVGYGQQPVKVAVGCGGTVAFYTDSLRTIHRFDLLLETQMDPYSVLPADSPYIYGGIAVMPGESGDATDTIIAMTVTGDGPSRCAALADSRTFWTDELHPVGANQIKKWTTSDRTLLQAVATLADPGADNDVTLGLAVNFDLCRRSHSYAILVR